MSHSGSDAQAHAPAGMRVMYIVWGWLLALTLIEVFLAYEQFSLLVMLLALLGMSIVKAALIMSWFMHLKFERISVVLTIVPAMIMCLLLMNIIWPDGRRVRDRGVFRDLPSPVPGQSHAGAAGHGEGEAGEAGSQEQGGTAGSETQNQDPM